MPPSPRLTRTNSKAPPVQFAISHYAGLVTYSTVSMLDKNRDHVMRFPFWEHLSRHCTEWGVFVFSGTRRTVSFAVRQPQGLCPALSGERTKHIDPHDERTQAYCACEIQGKPVDFIWSLNCLPEILKWDCRTRWTT